MQKYTGRIQREADHRVGRKRAWRMYLSGLELATIIHDAGVWERDGYTERAQGMREIVTAITNKETK